MELTSILIFILSFLCWGFFSKRNPKVLSYLLVEQGITSSFGTADQALSWNTNGYSNIQKSPLYTTLSGFFGGSGFGGQASGGYLWSGTTYSGTNAYYLFYYSSNVTPAHYDSRQYGLPVRCIA